ncbi:hypothetical protein KCP73_25805 [Salmonella enterica subsp. enterica]|nr:hypothetical protein KCP73_25805 [Salmonella enterica subsp. enterica]
MLRKSGRQRRFARWPGVSKKTRSGWLPSQSCNRIKRRIYRPRPGDAGNHAKRFITILPFRRHHQSPRPKRCGLAIPLTALYRN